MIILPSENAGENSSENHRKLIVLLQHQTIQHITICTRKESKRKGQRTRFDDDIMVSFSLGRAIYNIQNKINETQVPCQAYHSAGTQNYRKLR
jgi:hypothetical protein